MDSRLVLDVIGNMAVNCHIPDIATLEGFVFWVVYKDSTIFGLPKSWVMHMIR